MLRRRKVVIAAATVVALLVVVVVTTRSDEPGGLEVAATGTEGDIVPPLDVGVDTTATSETTTTIETTTSTAPPESSSTSTTGPETTRSTVLRDPAGAWQVDIVEGDGRRCLEFVAGPASDGDLLCDATAPTGLVGDLVTFETPLGMAFVAAVAPSVRSGQTNLPIEAMQPNRIFPVAGDPRHPRLAYSAGIFYVGRWIGSGTTTVYWRAGDDHLGRSALPLQPGVVRAGANTVTGGPWGTWPGYRRAGSTGYLWAGDEEAGFYDGPDGTPCLLYRRLGGGAERLLTDICPPPATEGIFAYAAIVPAGGPSETGAGADRLVVLVDDPRVDRWRTAAPGATVDPGPAGPDEYWDYQVLEDPAGTGRRMLANFAGSLSIHNLGGHQVDVVAFAGRDEVGRITVDLPAS